MGKRARIAASLVICPLILTGCSLGTRPDGLPTPPGQLDCPAPGSQVANSGSLPTLDVHPPACIEVKEFQLQEAGQETKVDLERSSSGGIADLAYDHFTGELKPINGARVLLYSKDSGWLGGEPGKRSDFPGEEECHGKRVDEQNAFSEDDLKADFSIFCIKTAEAHDGFLFIKPVTETKPVAYYVYTYTWVR